MIKPLLIRYKMLNWAIADQLIVSGANFLTGIFIARLLGLEEFGRFTLIWLAVQLLTNIQESLLLSPMISIGAKLKQKLANQYYIGMFSLALVYSFFSATILYLLFFLLPSFFAQTNTPPALLIFLVTFLSLLQETLRRILFARSQLKLVCLADIISYLGQLALLIGLLFFQEKIVLNDVLLMIVSSTFLAIVFSYFNNSHLHFSMSAMYRSWKRSWPMAKWMVASTLSNWLTGNILIISAGIFLGNAAVGALKAAQNVLGINHILFKLIENIAPVKASKLLVEKGASIMVLYLKKLTLISVVFFLLMTSLIVIYAKDIMIVVYGAEFAQYSWLLVGYSGIYLFLLLGFPLRICLRSLEKTRDIFYAYLSTGLLCVLFSKFIVIYWGLAGIIFALVAFNILMVSMLTIFARRGLQQYNADASRELTKA